MQCKILPDTDLSEVPSSQKRQVAKPISHYDNKYSDRNTAITKAYKSGGYSLKDVGKYYNLHYSRVSRIVKAKGKLTPPSSGCRYIKRMEYCSHLKFAHELGHATDYNAGVASIFNAFVRKKGIKPVSWYGATGKSEAFPEAFAFYHADPEWMKANLPKMFTWFETLTTTGKPP